MNVRISVIVCTHNPRKDYLEKVISSLKSQVLPLKYWELMLIDNASSPALHLDTELSWHPNSHLIYEKKVGLTQARLTGFQSSKGELIIFVDDDNLLDQGYLEYAWEVSQKYSELGVWGGQTLPGFEETPPDWTKYYWSRVGVREFQEDQIVFSPQPQYVPIGAGMCVRRNVANKYVEIVTNDSRRSKFLGRQGKMLLGCEDLDLAWTANDLGLGIGLFTSLKLEHLIPKNRLEESYLLKAVEGSDYSEVILRFLRNEKITWKQRLRLSMPWLTPPNLWLASSRHKKFYRAGVKGRHLALQHISQKKLSSTFD